MDKQKVSFVLIVINFICIRVGTIRYGVALLQQIIWITSRNYTDIFVDHCIPVWSILPSIACSHQNATTIDEVELLTRYVVYIGQSKDVLVR